MKTVSVIKGCVSTTRANTTKVVLREAHNLTVWQQTGVVAHALFRKHRSYAVSSPYTERLCFENYLKT